MPKREPKERVGTQLCKQPRKQQSSHIKRRYRWHACGLYIQESKKHTCTNPLLQFGLYRISPNLSTWNFQLRQESVARFIVKGKLWARLIFFDLLLMAFDSVGVSISIPEFQYPEGCPCRLRGTDRSNFFKFYFLFLLWAKNFYYKTRTHCQSPRMGMEYRSGVVFPI